MNFLEKFSWTSSDVDWCEGNFATTNLIAEFYNTISNVLFFVFPPLLVLLFRPYAKRVTSDVNIVWALLAIVGLGSVYFHATLSLVGQLMDEIAIIWVFMAALCLWFPHRYLPVRFRNDRRLFRRFMIMFTLLSTGLACIEPSVNHVVMFVMAIPATILMILELRICESRSVYNLGIRCVLMWLLAISSWVSDRLFCGMWKHLGFPFLHSGWHIFVALGAYQTCVLFAYFDAKARLPNEQPVMKYWPSSRSDWMGVAYVSFKSFRWSSVEDAIY